jgi:hypothetical protein
MRLLPNVTGLNASEPFLISSPQTAQGRAFLILTVDQRSENVFPLRLVVTCARELLSHETFSTTVNVRPRNAVLQLPMPVQPLSNGEHPVNLILS